MLTHLTLFLCLAIFSRLFTYQRDGARYRPGISVLATLVMTCCGAAVIYILSGKLLIAAYAWPLVSILAVFTFGVWRCRGNLAMVLESPKEWDGRDRRHSP